MYVDNNWYGHRTILFKYANVKKKIFFGGIQHGIFNDGIIKLFNKKKFPFIQYLCWNEKISNYLKKKKNFKSIIPIGSPFIYLTKMLKYKSTKKKGTLVFPAKSTLEDNPVKPYYEKLIAEVEKKFKGPYCVCIYYADLKNNLKIFKNNNWKIICMGRRSNEKFLINFINHVQKYKNFVCQNISSNFFYLCFLKKKPHLIIDKFNKEQQKFIKPWLKKYKNIDKNNFKISKLKKIADEELGYKHIKSSEQLSKIFDKNNLFINCFACIAKKFFDLVYFIKYKTNIRNS
jgi:hypothetical protein